MTPPRVVFWCALLSGSAWAAPAVFAESAMVKVRPSNAAHADSGAQLSAARNEFVSFQVVVHGQDSGATGVRATLSPLTGPGTISGADLTLYREALLDLTTPSTPDAQTGWWPDPLVPDVDEIAGEQRTAFPFDVPAGEARAIWVDIHVPADAAPGSYAGTVSVSGGAGLAASVPVTVNVINAAMPSTPSLTTAFLIFAPNVCQAHGSACGTPDQTNALVARYQRLALEHRLTLTNLPQGDPNADWSAFDAAYGPFLDGTAPSRLAGARMTTVAYFGNQDVASYGAFAAHFQGKGWLDRAFDYTADEPPATSWAALAARAALVRQGAPGLRTLTTTNIATATANGVLDDLDILTPNIFDIDPYGGTDQGATYAAFLGAPNKKLWLYQSCNSHGCGGGTVAGNSAASGWPDYVIDASAARNRAMEWVSFREGASGELYYETAMMLPSAWTSVYSFNGNGDGTLFYPGTPQAIGGTTDVPVASIRLKLIRMGIQDYEWLKMVSDAGDPKFAQQVAADAFPHTWAVSDDGTVLEGAREKLVKRLAQLQPAPATAPTGSAGAPASTGTPAQPNLSPNDVSSVARNVQDGARGRGCSAAPGALAPALIALLALMRRAAARRSRGTAAR